MSVVRFETPVIDRDDTLTVVKLEIPETLRDDIFAEVIFARDATLSVLVFDIPVVYTLPLTYIEYAGTVMDEKFKEPFPDGLAALTSEVNEAPGIIYEVPPEPPTRLEPPPAPPV